MKMKISRALGRKFSRQLITGLPKHVFLKNSKADV